MAVSSGVGTLAGGLFMFLFFRSNKPLIVTTNLKLDELKHPPDLAHARIYDRI